MIPLSYDLHIHSCLSPCGDSDMTPGNIIGMASLKGLQVIALTDHNSCRNCPAAMKHGADNGVIVIPGMELTTSEEVHVICLFPDLEPAMRFDRYVYEHLLPIKNKEAIFGRQQIINEEDIESGTEERLLISATDLSFDDVFHLTAGYDGFAFPAHIDKASTSLLSNLGFVPLESTFSCAEIRDFKNLHHIQKEHPYFRHCNMISNSDAHYLEDIHEADYQLYVRSRSISDILKGLSFEAVANPDFR